MAMDILTGMVGNDSWATDQRPKNWREMILRLYPNGDAPLTALTGLLKSESVDDPEFNWWTKTLPTQAGSVTNIYTDSSLSSAYASGGSDGDILFVKMAEAVAEHFREGHIVTLRDSDQPDVDTNAKVLQRVTNGASSYLQVELLEDDDNGTDVSKDLSDADYIEMAGNSNAEGAQMPDVLTYLPEKYYNYTQISRTSLEITRTAMKTRLRTGDAYKEMKRQALELHSIELEKALLRGIASENTGDNGQPERTTTGIISFTRANSSANCHHYPNDHTTKSWEAGGMDWLMDNLEVLFRYGKDNKMCFAGSGAILGLNKLAMQYSDIQLRPTDTSYGIRVMEWITPFGQIALKRHPLFSYSTIERNAMLFFEPERLKWRYIDDTAFYPDPNRTKKNGPNGWTRIDGIKEEWLTEGGLEYHFPLTGGFFTGVGQDGSSYSA